MMLLLFADCQSVHVSPTVTVAAVAMRPCCKSAVHATQNGAARAGAAVGEGGDALWSLTQSLMGHALLLIRG